MAPLIIVLARLLQGLVTGGEFVPLPSVPAEPPTYRTTLEGGAVVVGYLVKD
jgi:hypothetical protein